MERRFSITPRDLECILCDETTKPKALPLSLLEEITDGFSDEQQIGRGGFAEVYKGKLKNKTVAVKRISKPYVHEKDFLREVECLMMVKHKNIVRFLGYCADTQGSMETYNGKLVMADVHQKLLCFEYLPKGSLHEYITDTARPLQWRDRYRIITGICQGLHHLHRNNIVHLDLKPANVLLDDNFVPKIADFGLSRCFTEMQSRVMTMNCGTLGYLAPEFFDHAVVTYRDSHRLDIHSLGVIITEILTGKRGYKPVDSVVESWSNMLEKSQSNVQLEQVRVCAEIGMKCTDRDPAKRPDTEYIITRLSEIEAMDGYIETGVITSQQPIQPAIKILYCRDGILSEILSMDVHPTKPWIVAAHGSGHVSIWNYETQERMMALRPFKEPAPCAGDPWMLSAKFIAREQRFVAGDGYGYIHVLSCTTMDEITEFKAHTGWIESLAVHPSRPLVLSASGDTLIKLWNWESGWSCDQIFQAHSCNVQQVKFNPLEGNTFASASVDGTAKLWTIYSPIPIATLDSEGEAQICVDYFSPGGDRHYVVTGSRKGVARIWDLQTKQCIKKLRGLQGTSGINVAVIDGIWGHPILITSSDKFAVSLRNCDNYGIESTVDFNFDRVRGGFAYITAIKRLVIGFDDGFGIMKIN